MTAAEFRRLALAMPDVVERSHFSHPDFRVGGKIFATLTEDGKRGMVKLPPREQRRLLKEQPGVFEPASGAWGRQGCTMVLLKAAKKADVREALIAAWHARQG